MLKTLTTAAVLALGVTLLAAPAVEAQKAGGTCVMKAGEGTNTTVDGAKFQAWEAVLQATDWSVWGAMMSSKQEVGNAPGMKVSKLKSSCNAGGLGHVCRVQAMLCR
jgi:hypothetical protein